VVGEDDGNLTNFAKLLWIEVDSILEEIWVQDCCNGFMDKSCNLLNCEKKEPYKDPISISKPKGLILCS